MMSQKRQPPNKEVGEEEDEEEGFDVDGGSSSYSYSTGEKKKKKRQKKGAAAAAFRSVVKEAVRRKAVQSFLSLLEPFVREVVKEEVEQALQKHSLSMKRQCAKQIYPSTSRCLQLQFGSMPSLPIFTGAKIEDEYGALISIALVDVLTGDYIKSGPESMMKIEVVVLEGDFEGNEEDNWTHEEFKNNIVKERQGKRTLLIGDVLLNLKEGTCVVSDLAFTDNSSWTRSRKFRLGARVENGFFDGTRVKEAMTVPFIVKDHRGELYKKHHPPSLDDEVWRLEKIGKDGAFHKRLSKEKIKTVKDFLMLLCIDTPRLRNILGNGMSTKMWEVTVEHARTCILNNQLYVYYQGNEHKVGAVFNVVGELKGIISEQKYIPVSNISDTQKIDARKLVKVAYEHRDDVCILDMDVFSSEAPTTGESLYNECSISQKIDMSGFPFLSVSTPDIMSSVFSMDSPRNLDSLPIQSSEMEPAFSNNFLCHDAYKPDPLFFDVEPRGQSFFSGDSSQFLVDPCMPLQNLYGSSSDLATAVSAYLPACAKVNRKWRRLLPVFRMTFSLKRIVASKREQRHRRKVDMAKAILK